MPFAIARVLTEDWGSRNLYCAACDSSCLSQCAANTRAVDYNCNSCKSGYQLKASLKWSEARIPDAGYESMVSAIRSDRVPNLLVLQYSSNWSVVNLLLVPSFFFSESAIQKRKPLGPSARRAGWVGCNILLNQIAPEGKIRLVSSSVLANPAQVRAQYQRIKPLAELKPATRGWTLNVLKFVHRIGRKEFSLTDVYVFENELADLYPNNRHVRPKIRQQLQVLRDMGFLRFLGNGEYSVL